MNIFNYRFFRTLMYKLFLDTIRRPNKPRFKQLFVLFLFSIWFIPQQIFNWICFFLDEILFNSYKKIEVKPLFIIGVPRSGTTFLQRIISKDHAQFTGMSLWEVCVAPAICQKYFFLFLGRLDRLFGSPIFQLMVNFESWWFKNLHQLHRLSWFDMEEDEALFLHQFSSFFLIYLFPYQENFKPYIYYDQEVPYSVRKKQMEFYKNCVRRHLYVFGSNKRFLSKNPHFCPRIESIMTFLPESRFILIIRNPISTIPSNLSVFQYLCTHLANVNEGIFKNRTPIFESTMEMIRHWYHYPLAKLTAYKKNRYEILNYDEFRNNPRNEIKRVYHQLGLEYSSVYDQEVKQIMDNSSRYRSMHQYSLVQFGLSKKRILQDFRLIFKRWNFSGE